MTKSVGVHEAKTHLSRLLRDAEMGEEIEILRGGSPVARIVPIASTTPRFGLDEGVFEVPDDFDAPDPEMERLFGA